MSNHGIETPAIREASKNTPNTEESKNIKNDDKVPEQIIFNLESAVSPQQKNPSRQAAKRSIPNATKSASHYTPAVQPRSSSKPTEGDNFIDELKNEGIVFVDNREQSGIVWVLYSADVKATVETLSNKHQCKLGLEKRGSIATNNRPAWRVVF